MGHSKKKRKGSRNYSILQGKEKYCYVTGRTEYIIRKGRG